jgi:hypothetical protein
LEYERAEAARRAAAEERRKQEEEEREKRAAELRQAVLSGTIFYHFVSMITTLEPI